MSTVKPCIDLQDYDEINVEKQIDGFLERYYDKHYNSFEEFQKDFWKQIDHAIKDIEAGNGIPMEIAVAETRARYGI